MAKPIRSGYIDPKAMQKLRDEPNKLNVFAIRVTNAQKADLYEMGLNLREQLNEALKAGDPKYGFNDAILKALHLGFEQLKRKRGK